MKKEERAVRAKKHIKIASSRSWSNMEEILSNTILLPVKNSDTNNSV